MRSTNIGEGRMLFDRTEGDRAIRERGLGEIAMGIKLCIQAALGLGLVIAAPAQTQPIYLHSPSEQQTTADLVTNLKTARDAHLAALNRHDAELESAMQREQAAVIRRAFASRDVIVARYLERDVAALGETLKVRLQSLTGSDAGDETMAKRLGPLTYESREAEARFFSNLDLLRKRRLELDRRQGELQLAIARGDVPNKCELTQLLTPDEQASSDQNECFTARQAYQQLLKLIPCNQGVVARTTLAALAGVQECWANGVVEPLRLKGELGNALGQRRNLLEAIERQRQAANLVKGELAELEKHLVCEQAKAALPSSAERIAKVAGQIDALLAFITQLDRPSPAVMSEQGTAAADKNLSKCEAKNSKDAVVATAEPVSLTGLVRELQGIVSFAPDFKQARGIWASAAEAAQDFRATKLGEILQAVATPGEESDDRAGTIVRALVRTAAPIEMLAQVRAGTLPDTSGTLVALAEARMRAATAALEAGRLTGLEALARQRIVALTNELVFAGMAMGADASSDRALVHYAASIERGRIPADVLAIRMNAIEYEVWSKRERAAVEAGYAVLATAAAELKTYGEGGIRPDIIAQFLNLAGIAAIAESN